MNKAVIIGNLTKDPELRHTPSGTAVCTLRVAVNDSKPDGNGGYKQYAHYFDVVVWGKQAENCAQWLSKGKKIGVTGKLEWQEWEAQDGTKRQKVEIVADNFGIDFLTPRDENTPAGDRTNGSARPQSTQQQAVPAGNGYGGGADDDIPF